MILTIETFKIKKYKDQSYTIIFKAEGDQSESYLRNLNSEETPKLIEAFKNPNAFSLYFEVNTDEEGFTRWDWDLMRNEDY